MRIITSWYFKLALALAFCLVIAVMMGPNIVRVFDMPTIAFLVFGIAILTLIRYRKDMSRNVLLDIVKKNCIITGFLGFVIGFLMALTTTKSIEELPAGIAISFLMVPYSALFYWLTDLYKTRSVQSGEIAADSRLNTSELTDILGGYGLSEREKAIAESLMAGMSNKEIANVHFISENTVKKHISSIFKKAGVKSRYELLCLIKGTTS